MILALVLVIQGTAIFWKQEEMLHFFFKTYRTILVRWSSKIPFLRNGWKEGTYGGGEAHHFHLAFVMRIMGWNCIKYIFVCLLFYFTGLALGIQLPLLKSFFFIPFVQLSGLIILLQEDSELLNWAPTERFISWEYPTPSFFFVLGQRILLFFSFLVLFVLNHLFTFDPVKRQESGRA